ncbi:MAG: hypothetical protein RIN56_16980 [Sporomusaceae bacterium]|nr:hypothetical protein [Sporomusaceae bacterium]
MPSRSGAAFTLPKGKTGVRLSPTQPPVKLVGLGPGGVARQHQLGFAIIGAESKAGNLRQGRSA